MTYLSCRSCGFWVKSQIFSCPNCGLAKPTVQIKAKPRDVTDKIKFACTVSGAFGTMGAAAMFAKAHSEGDLWAIPAWGVTGLLIGFMVGSLAGNGLASFYVLIRAKYFPSHNPNCYQRSEQLTYGHLQELALQEHRLSQCREMVRREAASPQWRTAAETLQRGEEAIHRRRVVLKTKLWEVALARWENILEPLGRNVDSLTFEESGEYIQMLLFAEERAKAMLLAWERSEAVSTKEGQACIVRLQEGYAKCEPLRQSLVAQQSILAMQGLGMLDPFAGVAGVPPSLTLDREDIEQNRAVVRDTARLARSESRPADAETVNNPVQQAVRPVSPPIRSVRQTPEQVFLIDPPSLPTREPAFAGISSVSAVGNPDTAPASPDHGVRFKRYAKQ